MTDGPMQLSAELSAIAILVHTAIEELNPAATDEYYNCEPLDCASGLGLAVKKGWLSSGATWNDDGSINNLFLVRMTDAGKEKVEALLALTFQR